MAETKASELPWTTRRLLAWMATYLEQREIDSPRLSAELLVAHVIGCDRLRLYMEVDRPAQALELQTLRGLVERAGKHEPIAYLLGEAWFFGKKFRVTRDTLIPRPSTATLVEHALQHQRAEPGFEAPVVVDIATGSGVIAVTIAAQLPTARVIATDVSAAALEVARGNARAHGVADRIEFVVGDLLAAIEPMAVMGQVDYLVSNPPYISDSEWRAVPADVREYEPEIALRAGKDGLKYLGPLIEGAARVVREGGRIAFEIAASQKEAVLRLAGAQPELTEARVLNDHENLPRVLVAKRRGR